MAVSAQRPPDTVFIEELTWHRRPTDELLYTFVRPPGAIGVAPGESFPTPECH